MRTLLLVAVGLLLLLACQGSDQAGAPDGAEAGAPCEWPGDECASGSCREWLRVCQAGPGEACTLAVGCARAGGVRHGCVDGTCRPRGAGVTGASCATGADCASARCLEGICVSPCSAGIAVTPCADDPGSEACSACSEALVAAVPDAPNYCWSDTGDCFAPALACMASSCPWDFCEWWARVEAAYPDGLPDACRS